MVMANKEATINTTTKERQLNAIIARCNCPHWVYWCSHLNEFYSVIYGGDSS
jgi:hypothetical protein